jgi:hypothetical protein
MKSIKLFFTTTALTALLANSAFCYEYCNNDPVNNVDPLGLLVLVGQHPAFVNDSHNPLNHAAIIVIPDNPADFAGNPNFTGPSTSPIATIGGQAFGGWVGLNPFGTLKTAINYPGDCPKGLNDLTVVPTPKGQTDTEFINNLLNAANAYGNDLPYSPFPNGYYYNSNSYVSGVISAAGGAFPAIPHTGPGYSHPLPIPYMPAR